MLVCIVGVALLAHLAFGFSPGAAILLGAVIAPTDPVLAGAISVSDATDRDPVRYALSGEAGLNDGLAFPFVVFGLLWIDHEGSGSWILDWAAHRLIWAIPAALAIGYAAGLGLGRFAISLRNQHRDDSSPNDFFALALVALVYVGTEFVGAWGFLSAFAAGVGLRRAEMKVVDESPHPDARRTSDEIEHGGAAHSPAEDLIPPGAGADKLEEPAIAAGVLVSEALSFGATAERLLEAFLMVMIGASLVLHWDTRAILLVAVLFVVLRPLSTALCLKRTCTTFGQRLLIAWFGIRGIGSLYYLMYALREAENLPGANDLVNVTVSVVAISVIIHGATSRPLLTRYQRSLERQGSAG